MNWGWSQSLPDGSFKLTGLSQGTYTLSAQSGTGTFAVRPGVATGAKNVGLVLQPGGRIVVTAVTADGQPVSNAWAGVDRVNGLPVNALGHAMRATDAQGTTEMLAPAGDLRLYVRKDKLRGTATVSLAAGETVSVTVRMEEPAPVSEQRGHAGRDAVHRLERGAPHVRRGHDVVEAEELVVRIGRLVPVDVEARAGDAAARAARRAALAVHQLAAPDVDQVRGRLHAREARGVDQPARLGRRGHVQADVVGARQQRVELAAARRPTKRPHRARASAASR